MRALTIFTLLFVAACTTVPTTPEPGPSPAPTTSPPSASNLGARIDAIVDASPKCTLYRWKNRSVAPVGYIKGMARTFARTYCRKDPTTNVAGLIGRSEGDEDHDAFAWVGLDAGPTVAERILTTYVYGIGLGMRESSGKYCEGRDRSVPLKEQTSSTTEAGLFQASYNSINASSRLKDLWGEYKDHPEWCELDTFKVGVDADHKECAAAPVGSGSGLEWQRFMRACPAAATEHAMSLTRNLRKHFGPINTRAVEFYPPCEEMLKKVAALPGLCG